MSYNLFPISLLTCRQREKKQTMSKNNGIPLLDEKRSFSLIFRGAKTLDLMVDEGGDREQILYILNSIVTEYGRAKVKVGNEVLLLRYVWNDVVNCNDSPVIESMGMFWDEASKIPEVL